MQAMVVAKDQDEKDILGYLLQRTGLVVTSSADLARSLASFPEYPTDLILLALTSSESPHKAVEAVRSVTETALLLVVDPLPEREFCDLIKGGADLVLQRPVSSRVLSAYATSLAKRSGSLPSFVLPSLSLNKITLDPATRTVTVAGQDPQRLTGLEFNLLYVLMTNRGHVVPLDVIVERVWGFSGEGNRELVRGLVSRLRHKIESDDAPGRFLETIPGVGYRFLVGE